MKTQYIPKKIERKWQTIWEDEKAFAATEAASSEGQPGLRRYCTVDAERTVCCT